MKKDLLEHVANLEEVLYSDYKELIGDILTLLYSFGDKIISKDDDETWHNFGGDLHTLDMGQVMYGEVCETLKAYDGGTQLGQLIYKDYCELVELKQELLKTDVTTVDEVFKLIETVTGIVASQYRNLKAYMPFDYDDY